MDGKSYCEGCLGESTPNAGNLARPTICTAIYPAFIQAAQAKLAQSSQDILKGYELKYVLTRAGNWLGPIGTFKLTDENPSPDALVALCAQGIKKARSTTFALAEDDYSPSEDLSVLFLEPLKEKNLGKAMGAPSLPTRGCCPMALRAIDVQPSRPEMRAWFCSQTFSGADALT
jgi:hypothetical protein